MPLVFNAREAVEMGNGGIERTFIFVVVDELIRSHHVHETHDRTVLVAVRRAGAGKQGDGADTAVETSGLMHANGSARHFEVAVAEGDVVKAFDDVADDFVVDVFAKGDAL
jgi:hypothetical protein